MPPGCRCILERDLRGLPADLLVGLVAGQPNKQAFAARRGGVARWFQPRSLPPTMPSPSREDGSTIHVVQFDPDTGAVVLKRTHQGYSDDSTWSR